MVQAKYCSANVLFSRENDEFNAPVCLCNVLGNLPFALKMAFWLLVCAEMAFWLLVCAEMAFWLLVNFQR